MLCRWLELENHELESELRALREHVEGIRTQSEALRKPSSTTFPTLVQGAERARTTLEEAEKRYGTKFQTEQKHCQAIQEAFFMMRLTLDVIGRVEDGARHGESLFFRKLRKGLVVKDKLAERLDDIQAIYDI
jgi:hypothetical protein